MKKVRLLIITLFFTGCARDVLEPKIEFKKPSMQTPKVKITPKTKKGSLFSATGTSLFADKKNLQIGDIIQVSISESVRSDSKGERKLTKDNSMGLGGGVVSPALGASIYGGVNNLAKKINSVTSLGFNSTSKNSFSGKVSSKHNEKFTTTLSAVITEVYANGNYYITATKELLIDGQLQSIILSGIIRPYDITAENSVDSSQIASLQLLYKKSGIEDDTIQKPWGSVIMDKVWPF